MSQLIKTKYFGSLTFVRTWAAPGMHIGLLANGAYAHIGGLPVSNQADLTRVIPAGPDLDEALDWFENRDKRAMEAKNTPARLVFFHPGDKSWRYVDTQQPVDTVEDLYQALKGSSALNEAIGWFVEHRKQTGDTPPPLDETGSSIDERLLRLLGEAQGNGLTAKELAEALAIHDVSDLVPILKTMDEQQRIGRISSGKRFVLPEYADKAVVRVGSD